MASLSQDRAGRWLVQFVSSDRKRKTLRLGRMQKKNAESIRLRVEYLNAAIITGTPIDPETAAWVGKLGNDFAGRLAAVGLTMPRKAAAVVTLGRFATDYIDSRSDVKPNTRRNLLQSRRYLVEFFGDGVNLHAVTQGEADRFGFHMKGEYAEATAARVIKHARQFFTAACRAGLLTVDPFAEVKAGSMENRDRIYYVSADATAKLIAAAPDCQWRLLIALARYGGLRTPSEPLALTWPDVDWERGRILIRSPKTGNRWIPLFAELRPHLEAARSEAGPDEVYVITMARDSGSNFRTTFEKIVHRAGLLAWPRAFQNLRASRETELTQSFPLHVVTTWIGNSATVAARHYLQVTDADFERAAESAARALHLPTRLATEGQSVETQKATESPSPCGVILPVAYECGTLREVVIPLTGGALPATFPADLHIHDLRAAESDAYD